MATGSLQINRDIILATRKQYLNSRRDGTPVEAILALAQMQRRPRPIFNTVQELDEILLIGQVSLTEKYDPVMTALRLERAGVDAVSFFTDHTIYSRDLDDLLMVTRGVRRLPVIFQNYVFDEYGVMAARGAGASSVVVYADILEPDMLRRVVSIAQRWKMSVAVQISSELHLEQLASLTPHAVCIGDSDEDELDDAFDKLEAFRAHIPPYCKVMLSHELRTLEEVEAAVDADVNAIFVTTQVFEADNGVGYMNQILGRE